MQDRERDLELARACERGDETAWERFVAEYRPILYRSADAIDPSGGAREVADSLYAELYGLKEHDGKRRSLFVVFSGPQQPGDMAPRHSGAAIRGSHSWDPRLEDWRTISRTVINATAIAAATPRRWKGASGGGSASSPANDCDRCYYLQE